jgi:hypothetical protein
MEARRLHVDHKRRRLLVYLVFVKAVNVNGGRC